ncbi:MAG TPA: Rrf2 family transcriptional regulator [Acidimicrobiales bacterium]|nr:Rrf2 family transcriptional regulator [Acidimicrobiales bacterium]
MEISARSDYGIRALAELTAVGGGPRTVTELAAAQDIPPRFLQNILLQLRRRGLVQSQRGTEGGYRLARDADRITLADVMRALEGPLAGIRGARPESVVYEGGATAVLDVWLAVRVSMRSVLEEITLQDLVEGKFPDHVAAAAAEAKAELAGRA